MKPDLSTAHPDARETVAYAELLKLALGEGRDSVAIELTLKPSEVDGDSCPVCCARSPL